MKQKSNILSSKIRLGWILLAISLIAILGGLAVRFFSPALQDSFQWVIGLGILFLGIGVAILGKYLPAMRSAQSAARQENSEMDERNLSIRNAAGYLAFLAAVIANYVVLFVYSSVTRGAPGLDLLWYALAFLAVFPIGVFIFFMVHYQKKM
jgi:peptidoglycan/LPS O-acetylase OafA/YrhL